MIEKHECEELRRKLKVIADEIGQRIARREAIGEAIANLTLAYRHIEDASMRLGKVIQALDGGVSVYDRTQVPAAGD